MFSYEKLSGGQKVVMLGAVLAVLCFFLPWQAVLWKAAEGGEAYVTVTGWQRMVGATLKGDISGRLLTVHYTGEALFLLWLLPGLVVFGVVFNALQRRHATKADALAFICLGIIPLFMLWQQFLRFQDAPGVLNQFGLLGTAIGYGVVTVGGVLDLRLIRKLIVIPQKGVE